MRRNDRERIANASLKMKYVWVAVLTMTTIVYLLPYTYNDFYNHFLEAFHITDGQAGKVLTFFGLTATPGYFIGGWLADKFNPKRLVVISTLGTGLCGFWLSFCESYTMLMVIYFLFGITTTCMHWGAFLKMIKSWGTPEEQGRLFGVENSMCGAVGLISCSLSESIDDRRLWNRYRSCSFHYDDFEKWYEHDLRTDRRLLHR